MRRVSHSLGQCSQDIRQRSRREAVRHELHLHNGVVCQHPNVKTSCSTRPCHTQVYRASKSSQDSPLHILPNIRDRVPQLQIAYWHKNKYDFSALCNSTPPIIVPLLSLT